MTYLWLTNDGQELTPQSMTTVHLFHTVRMLFNHTVAPAHQLKPYRQWSLTLDSDERAEAMTEMLAELGRRLDKSDLSPTQLIELAFIRTHGALFSRALNELPVKCDDGWPYDSPDEHDLA